MNLAIITGRLTEDPQQRQAGNGTVATFSVATEHSFKKGEEWVKIPTYHNITCWNKQAESVMRFLEKGCQVSVTGRIENQEWEKDGQTQRRTRIVAQKVEFFNMKAKPEAQKTPIDPQNDAPINVDDIPF